jgi:alpha-tubulin suppressor-like RCC1 family protein
MHFSLILTANGKLYSMGANDHSQLGIGKISDLIPNPQQVPGPWGDRKIIAIQASSEATAYAMDEDWNIYGWGENSSNLLREGGGRDVASPKFLFSAR